jgi:ABC-type siderophore export system fused ATPase/permease subunit
MQSAFFGLVACLRNYRAFVVYFASLLAICLVLIALIAAIAELAGGAKEDTARLLLVPVMIVLFAIVTAANYLSYRDIFRDVSVAGPEPDAPVA